MNSALLPSINIDVNYKDIKGECASFFKKNHDCLFTFFR